MTNQQIIFLKKVWVGLYTVLFYLFIKFICCPICMSNSLKIAKKMTCNRSIIYEALDSNVCCIIWYNIVSFLFATVDAMTLYHPREEGQRSSGPFCSGYCKIQPESC